MLSFSLASYVIHLPDWLLKTSVSNFRDIYIHMIDIHTYLGLWEVHRQW